MVGGITRNHDGQPIEIGGVEDHVHMLVGIPAKMAVSDTVRIVKANSAKWINDKVVPAAKFQWQTGYAAFTVSYSQCESVRRYIQNQLTHHQTQTFKEEFIAILERHGVQFDSRFVFETEHVG